MNQVTTAKDLGDYTLRLGHAMADKLFFVERLPPDITVFADFGCADGRLLREVHMERREWPGGWDCNFVGFDHDPAMIDLARQRRTMGKYEYTSDVGMFRAKLHRLHKQGLKSCLILSSVVHEVLSDPSQSFTDFWALVRDLGCEYIAIRDMAVLASASRLSPDIEVPERQVHRDPDVAHVLTHWVGTPGTFSSRREMLEGLLKARYRDNWEKEYAERYFPLTAEQWLNLTTIGSGYKLRHFDHAPLPFLQQDWWVRYGLHVPDPTHIKLLLQRER